MCVRVCVRACALACVLAWVCACLCVCACVCLLISSGNMNVSHIACHTNVDDCADKLVYACAYVPAIGEQRGCSSDSRSQTVLTLFDQLNPPSPYSTILSRLPLRLEVSVNMQTAHSLSKSEEILLKILVMPK